MPLTGWLVLVHVDKRADSAKAPREQVLIYALANPQDLVNEIDSIRRCVFRALGIDPKSSNKLDISPSSGWLDYSVEGELWERDEPAELPSEAEAIRLAEEALAAIEIQCSIASRAWPDSLRKKGISLMPPIGLTRRAGTHAIARPSSAIIDHWLYRAEPHLLLDAGGTKKASVFGSQIEVRIGHMGKIIGIMSRWSPHSAEVFKAELHPPPAISNGEDPHSNDTDPMPEIVFVLDGSGIPQYYLAPYYCQVEGHDISMLSASQWSLTVEIGRIGQDEATMTLVALAYGGSGRYEYNWALYTLPEAHNGFVELGSGQSQLVSTISGKAISSKIVVDAGYYVALVNVRDQATGAFKHHQQTIFSSPTSTGFINT